MSGVRCGANAAVAREVEDGSRLASVSGASRRLIPRRDVGASGSVQQIRRVCRPVAPTRIKRRT